MVAEHGPPRRIQRRTVEEIVGVLVPRILDQIIEAITMIREKRVSERTRLQPHAVEQKDKTKGNEQQAAYAREHAVKVEAGLQKISDSILALMDKNLIPSESAGEPKVFYYKMNSNFYRYPAEYATCDTKSKAVEDARVAYAEATKVFQNPDEACKMARRFSILTRPLMCQL